MQTTLPDPDRARRALPDVPSLRVAIVGYGEVGSIFAKALSAAGVGHVAAFDVLVDDVAWRARGEARAAHDRVHLAATRAEALSQADLVLCAVTAASTEAAARQIAQHLARDAFVLDLNSASPRTKTRCAGIIDDAGGRYVEAAVMTSVPPHGIRAPMLVGGPHAAALLPYLARLGFDAKLGASTFGVVSATKLCRSVVIKGMEALIVESLLAARHYGVEREVLASLGDTFPGLDWEQQATYFWKRVVAHGRRRAEEMQEAAAMVDDAGITAQMSRATVAVQNGIATLRAGGAFDAVPAEADWRGSVDAVHARGRGDA